MNELISVFTFVFLLALQANVLAQHEEHSNLKSQYAGQQDQSIKALSPSDIEGLKAGAGTPFSGMAKPAELNGYPGPRHVLDAFEADEFNLSEEQHSEIRQLFEKMQQKAIPLGEKIITIEKKLDNAFKNGEINSEDLRNFVSESAQVYADLRFVHLNTHLKMMDILDEDQINAYNKLRGYTSDDPCENVPEGHDPEMWKMHNGCE